MSYKITITWDVPAETYELGDYVRLHGNGGDGDIDYDTPLTGARYELFPDRTDCIEQLIIEYEITKCGNYKFALVVYDSLGNPNVGTIQELEAYIHFAPDAPTGLKPKSYNKDTDILILQAA